MNDVSSRMDKIDSFLNMWVKIYKQNSNFSFNDPNCFNYIYSELIRIGVNPNERKVDNSVNGNFDNWIRYYSNNPKINVFVSEDWKYFCQFISSKDDLQNEKDHIKMYIPLDEAHIISGAKIIFDFLTDNGIKHVSKIGKAIRFDDIVVRLSSEKDALALCNFVRSNRFIQDGLIKPNPFAFSNDGIAIASDGLTSYNSTVSKLLTLYFRTKEKDNDFSNVSCSDFLGFVGIYYENVFVNDKDWARAINDFGIDIESDNAAVKILNTKEVVSLFYKSFHPFFSFDSLVSHYKDNIDAIKNGNELREIERFISVIRKSTLVSSFNDFDLLIDGFNTMKSKYGQGVAFRNLLSYLNNDNNKKGKYLTRDNNIRHRFKDAHMRERLNEYLASCNTNLYDFLMKSGLYDIDLSEQIIDNGLMENYIKYQRKFQNGESPYDGRNMAMMAFRRMLYGKGYESFTRNNDCRENVERNTCLHDAEVILRRSFGIPNNQVLDSRTLDTLCNIYTTDVINKKIANKTLH